MDVCLQSYGESGFLLAAPEFEVLEVRQCVDAALQERPLAEYLEHIWGAHTVLLLFRGPVTEVELQRWFECFDASAFAQQSVARLHEVPVVYDGPDLEAVADLLSVSTGQIIRWHTQPEYQVRMMGFSPGFPYLDGLDSRLQLPRRASPRKRIEPGSVAIGGPHAGIYSVASPGGWHLLGRTDWRLFKPELASGDRVNAAAVFSFRTGDRVRFVPIQQEVSR